MEIEVKQSIDVEEGRHSGTITKIAYRTEPYDYTDCFVTIDGYEGFDLIYGCPTYISPVSKLGRLLALFMELPKVGEKVDPEKVLLNQRISFLVQKKANKDGKEYARVVEDSVKPLVVPKEK